MKVIGVNNKGINKNLLNDCFQIHFIFRDILPLGWYGFKMSNEFGNGSKKSLVVGVIDAQMLRLVSCKKFVAGAIFLKNLRYSETDPSCVRQSYQMYHGSIWEHVSWVETYQVAFFRGTLIFISCGKFVSPSILLWFVMDSGTFSQYTKVFSICR